MTAQLALGAEKVSFDPSIPLTGSLPMPLPCYLSFRPLLDDLAKGQPTGVATVDQANMELAAVGRLFPELMAPITDPAVLVRHADLIRSLMAAIFPVNFGHNVQFAAILPFQPAGFWASAAFANRLLGPGHAFRGQPVAVEQGGVNSMHRGLLHFLLTKGFAVPLPQRAFEELFMVPAADSQLPTFQNLTLDLTHCRAHVPAESAKLTPEQIRRVFECLDRPELAFQELPLAGCWVEGFTVIRAFDVTAREAFGQLKEVVMSVDGPGNRAQFVRAQELVQVVCGDVNVRIATMLRKDGGFSRVSTDEHYGSGCEMGREVAAADSQGSLHEAVLRSGKVFEQRCLQTTPNLSPLEVSFRDRGFSTLIAVPLRLAGQIVGVFELLTPKSLHELNYDLAAIVDLSSLFAIALGRIEERFNAAIEGTIKAHCTAVHPAVEWRFRQAAITQVRRDEAQAGVGQMEPIVFDRVYPLYGIADIRSSSLLRARAIQRDLTSSLNHLQRIFTQALTAADLPMLQLLKRRTEAALAALSGPMAAGAELSTGQLIRATLEPGLAMVDDQVPSLRGEIMRYRSATANDHGAVYEARAAFDHSVERLNAALAAYLDAKQAEAQRIFPHYFEKHVTDGVDHNIYVGASLDPSRTFRPIYVQNLRLWQLATMCGLARIAHQVAPQLPERLETAQLIVAQDSPLTIEFRYDERRFDVHGAYNIRYELMKKRIDKATIKGGGGRVTAPGAIVIVYSQERERDEYLEYIDELAKQGRLEAKWDLVGLDDLPDVSGLSAIRAWLRPAYLAGLTDSETSLAPRAAA